jgi:acyl-coenzyme A thioesterase PaaI-like protein
MGDSFRASLPVPRLSTMRGERVRGGLPDPGFYALPGLDQAQAIQRGLVPRPPLAHPTGLTVTQVGLGTAALTIPASPWLDHGTELLDIHVLAEATLSTAVLTGAPPAMDVRTAVLSLTHFRPATLDANTLIAHARTVRSAATFTFAEGAVEDDLGREIASFTGAVLVRPREPPPPATLPLGTPLEEPAYPTPDPYQRPLPAGVGPTPRQHWEQHDGFTWCIDWSPVNTARLSTP